MKIKNDEQAYLHALVLSITAPTEEKSQECIQIAELIGAYGCARQIGWSLKRLRLPSKIPWHRVINAKGEVSMSTGREGTDWVQIDLLKREGVFIDQKLKIQLRRYLWKPDLLKDSE